MVLNIGKKVSFLSFHYRKWYAHLALANLGMNKKTHGTTTTSQAEVTTADQQGARHNFRKLTPRRKKIVEEFMKLFERNATKCVSYGSGPWIRALKEYLDDRSILPVDIEHWLATETFFKRVSNSGFSLFSLL